MALLSCEDSTPRAYRLKASNAAPPISTCAGTSPLARAAVADLSKLGFTPRESRTKFLQLFRADQINPDAIEALRAEQSTKWDAATKRIAQAVAEAGQVLTPEQRRDLTER